jgi:fumarylacetoacetase
LRKTVSAGLSAGSADEALLAPALYEAEDCTLHLPATIGDYSDFYAGIHHARRVGALFRPDAPMLPNYKYVPIGYHGRASTIRPSGDPVHRPNGQRKRADETEPTFGPSRNLDYELELGIWIGPGNPPGTPIDIATAQDHIAGFCLLNDWSARDIQGWEYQPLGPFLAKSFATTISAWIVTPEALAPFRLPQPPRPEGDPAPLDYLLHAADQGQGALDLHLEVLLLTSSMRARGDEPQKLSTSNTTDLYWTAAQLVTHHASNGCALRPGDLLGSGTISGPERTGSGSLLELTEGGREPITLANGETRRFLEDGDEVIFRATAHKPGAVAIGLGARIG